MVRGREGGAPRHPAGDRPVLRRHQLEGLDGGRRRRPLPRHRRLLLSPGRAPLPARVRKRRRLGLLRDEPVRRRGPLRGARGAAAWRRGGPGAGLRRAARLGAADPPRVAATAFGASGFLSWGTTETDAAGGAEAVLAAKYAGFHGGRRIGAGGRDYLLGRNPWGASFIAGIRPALAPQDPLLGVGVRRRPADAARSSAARRRRARSSARTSASPAARSRGSTPKYAYEDRREDYVTSEPTIDSAAATVLLLAAMRNAGSG